jgi:hypothetical protein
MNVSPQTNATTDNIRIALAALATARTALFFGAKSLEHARKDQRLRELEWAVCDAIKAARSGA